MQRGTQGHVAEPRGPTRAPAWRGGDMCAHLHNLYIIHMVIVHTRIPSRNSLTVICAPPYKPNCFPCFSPCGTMFPSFLLIAGCVAKRGALDAI